MKFWQHAFSLTTLNSKDSHQDSNDLTTDSSFLPYADEKLGVKEHVQSHLQHANSKQQTRSRTCYYLILGLLAVMLMGSWASYRCSGATRGAAAPNIDTGLVDALPSSFSDPEKPSIPDNTWVLATYNDGDCTDFAQVLMAGVGATDCFNFTEGTSSQRYGFGITPPAAFGLCIYNYADCEYAPWSNSTSPGGQCIPGVPYSYRSAKILENGAAC